MLLRNTDQSSGLCNDTRLIITRMGRYIHEGKVISGSNIGHRVAIPRLSLTPSDKRIPFKFQRKQFPLMVSFAMTINKSQGQSLKHTTRNNIFNSDFYAATFKLLIKIYIS